MPKKVVGPSRIGMTKSKSRVAKRRTPKKRVAPQRTCRNARALNRVVDDDILELTEEPSLVCISDDSDDDNLEDIDLLTRTRGLNTAVDNLNTAIDCIPSTSNGDSYLNTASPMKPLLNTSLERDVMEYVDNFLEDASTNKTEPKVDDMKSLEEYRKETEEMLKSVSSLLDEFKAPKKPPETATKPETADMNEEKEVKVGSCPICLETFAGRPASVTICGHIFCKQCITLAAQTQKKCPTCRKGINTKKIHPIYF